MISKLIKLTLLNQSDDLDLISELVRLSQLPNVKGNYFYNLFEIFNNNNNNANNKYREYRRRNY